MYKLYYAPGACSLAPHIILEEIGTPYDLKFINTAKRENYLPAYLAINPSGRIPALDCGDFILTENPAILLHLGAEHPHLNLVPCERRQRARCMEMLAWLSSTVHVAYAQVLRPERFTAETAHYPQIAERGHATLQASFLRIEHCVRENKFALNCGFTVVDPFLLVFYRWGNRLGYKMKDNYPSWTDTVKNYLDRRSVQAALDQEGISIES